jgi:AcrR family transcriptional regulator
MIRSMKLDLAPSAPVKDRRVRRSRAALTRAAVALVTERGTAAVPLSDIAAAADVSRQIVYQHFGDRDTLLLEAALDLIRTELMPWLAEGDPEAGTEAGTETDPETGTRTAPPTTPAEARDQLLLLTRHFAQHRVFYRAMFNSSSASALNEALGGLFGALNRRAFQERFAGTFDPQQIEDLTVFVTGGSASIVNAWVTSGDEPLDPEDLADRMVGLAGIFAAAMGQIVTATDTKESGR